MRLSRKTISAMNAWVRTAFSETPMNERIAKVCLIQRKYNSIAQRRL